MWIIITLFVVGLLGTFSMLLFRSWQIETGLVEYSDDHHGHRDLVSHMSVLSMGKSMLYFIRWIGHIAIMLLIRLWVFASHAISTKWRKWFPKKEKIPSPQSHFLKSVSEYKHRVQKLREKLKEKEEKKVAEENDLS